ncbi:MAG: hypothetical protein IKE70_05430 [Bacilli bacterium]|nr:hypothetical protein [Bacilli bacterium]
MNSKILLIVEGETTEPKILGSESHGLLSLMGANYEIVAFANPIYELYEAYKNGEYDDLVSYLRLKKGLKIDDKILSKNAFSAIYLIFDYEPHYQKYSDETIKKLLNLFNNETELGKLYINYPMVEAYYHLKSLPDIDYYKRTVNLDNFNGKEYKKKVNLTTCLKKNKITKKELCFIIMHNYNKAKLITKIEKDINHISILESQLKIKKEKNEIYVLSTFPLLVIDYNYEKTMEILKLKLKNNYIEISKEEKDG